mmetsp:Transcript_16563/g.39659  ORF Transcript_16563/g.39659 Transcript_16563/m.39659 type:complete len:216 (+) Transcript_16563:1092-1739(+)
MITVGMSASCAAPLLVFALVVRPATFVASAMANELGTAIWGGRAGMGSRLDAAWMAATVAPSFAPPSPLVESQSRMSFPASCTAPPPTVTTISASASYASSHAASRPVSPPPMPMLVHSGAANMPSAFSMSTNLESSPSMNFREELFARTKTFFEPNDASSSMVADRKGTPTRTAFMPGGTSSLAMVSPADMSIIDVVLHMPKLRLLVIATLRRK